MFSWIASFIAGPVVNGILNGYKAKLAAGNETDRLAVELASKSIEADIARRNAQRDLGIAGMNHPVWWLGWVLFVIPVGLYNAAIFILSTLGIPPDTFAVLRVPLEQEQLARTVVEYFFLAQGGTGIAGLLVSRFSK